MEFDDGSAFGEKPKEPSRAAVRWAELAEAVGKYSEALGGPKDAGLEWERFKACESAFAQLMAAIAVDARKK